MQCIQIHADGLCGSCSLCVEACAETTGFDPGIFLSSIGDSVFPVVCRHCKTAPCVEICATQALFHSNAFVNLNPELCIRCGLCVLACPFGAIELDRKGVPVKCTGCPSLQSPPCVAACPRGIFTCFEK